MLDLLIGVIWALIGFVVCGLGWFLLFAVPGRIIEILHRLRTP